LIVSENEKVLEANGIARRWVGASEKDKTNQILLSFRKGVMYGRIVADSIVYEVKPIGENRYSIEELDSAKFPGCRVTENEVISSRGTNSDMNRDTNSSPLMQSSNDEPIQIDLMSVYTAAARIDAGGIAEIEAKIQAAVDVANTAFTDSDMGFEYRLVHIQEVNVAQSNDSDFYLDWLSSNSTVAALRDQHGADMVSLIYDAPNSCGLAYVQRNPGSDFASSAFQVTDTDCAVGNLTFAHEHGHNLGMEHNPENTDASTQTASYPYSFGHYVDGSFRSVMSYSNYCDSDCPRVAHFSNPDVTHDGVATGIVNSRDNARTGRSTGSIVANFRSPPMPELELNSLTINPSIVLEDEQFTISVVVANSGNEESSATTLRYYRSLDSTISQMDLSLGTDSVGVLMANQTSSKSISSSITEMGEFWIGACVDTVSNETNSANNCSNGRFIRVCDVDDFACQNSSSQMCFPVVTENDKVAVICF